MRIRKLLRLCHFNDANRCYAHFAYYEEDEAGYLKRTGDTEDCELTENEIYELLKPKLIAHHTIVARRKGR